MNCARAVLPPMINRKSGCIINISSMWGQVGASCEVDYSASKAGLIGFTKALAKDDRSFGNTCELRFPRLYNDRNEQPFLAGGLSSHQRGNTARIFWRTAPCRRRCSFSCFTASRIYHGTSSRGKRRNHHIIGGLS